MRDYQIEIKKVRDDKIQIEIKSKCSNREFDIIVSKDGLDITANDTVLVMPKATNKLTVDTAS